MIGTVLVIEGLHVHVPKGYIYVSMAFALGIEVVNMRIHRKSKRVVKSNTNNDQIGAEEYCRLNRPLVTLMKEARWNRHRIFAQ